MAVTLDAPPIQETIPDTMRAAVLFGPRDIRQIKRPVPRPGPGEVLVKVAMCGTCGTDLKIYDGHFPLTPPYGAFTPGHEWTGTVVALGDTVDEVAVGERVCIEAHHGCGRCDNCLIGRYTACLHYGNATKGHRATGMTADGGFAEYVLHHVSALYKMPPQVSFQDAVLLTTAGTGVDMAIECSGAVETPQQCIQVTKRGGKILVVAFYPQPVTLDMSAAVRGDITIYTTRGEGGNNVKRAVSLAAKGRLRGADLVTHEVPLKAIAEAFRVMRERVGDPIKIVVIP
jgi:threonine dehydrogenase-like Zn-dependent dehydrogenase